MNYTTSQYFSLNRMLLLAIGLWPFQQSKINRFQFIFLLSILTTAALFQFTTFITSKCTADLIMKVLPNAIVFTIFVIKYVSFAINIETVKDLLIQLQRVYDQLVKDEHESAIIKKYSHIAKLYTTAIIIFYISGMFILMIVQSNIINMILPINISRLCRLPIMTEYFVDQEKYLFLIMLHLNTAIFTGTFAVVAIGTMLIAYFIHICGLFKISSYHIKQAMRSSTLQNTNPKNNKLIKILKEITFAVHVQRQAMRLSKILVSRFEAMLFCLIVTGVVSLSLHLFQIIQAIKTENISSEILFPLLFALISILYMFCANYTGQNLTEHNNHIFVTVYDVNWYLAPLYIQRLVLFLLQRNAQDFTLGVGGLFTASLECFATLVKASVSYFTVMYSME